MKKTLLILLSVLSLGAAAYEKKDMLTKTADFEKVKAALVMDQKWVPYPAYADRAGWDKLTGEYKSQLIAAGEKALNYEWKVITASMYLEFERSGNRRIMEGPYAANNNAIANLFYAELAEGKGRFIDKLIDGVFQACEMTSWGLSAHSPGTARKRALPSHNEVLLELSQGGLSALLSWTYYYFKPEFDKVDPVIAQRMFKELTERELKPYMEISNYWWQAFNATPTTMVNNWNPWCNSNALLCFMLLENDRDKLAKAVYRTMVSVDKFIDYSNGDGACEEGPSYWGHAAGKMYDYLQSLYYITGGKVTVFDQPQIKNMGEYIAYSYVGDGWVVNFADASARGGGDSGLVYRYGKAVGSELMIAHAMGMRESSTRNERLVTSVDVLHTFELLLNKEKMASESVKEIKKSNVWYPQTEFCYMNDQVGGFFVATKGGYNNESHNHNDTGTFSLYVDNMPVMIDIGVGTYTRQTFSSERYSIWTMQSNFHNVPIINGYPQSFGSKYKATNTVYDQKKTMFSAEIGTSYPQTAKIKSYVRNYKLAAGKLTIEDNFSLTEAIAPNQINFMTWGKVTKTAPGKINVEVNDKAVVLAYNPKEFEAKIETIELTDPRLSVVWGKEVYRISLDATKTTLSGKYSFEITKAK